MMTDEQIIKAYERCFTLGFDESTCYECPFYTATAKCTEDLRDSVLALINRKQTKIEVLQKENKQLQSDVINANQNWDHIKGLWEREKEKVEIAKQKVICACKMLKDAKSEAIKEFAERLKDKIWYSGWCNLEQTITPEIITNIVKEMTEVQE